MTPAHAGSQTLRVPLHSTLSIGQTLAPDYFSPGTVVIRGAQVGSPWVIAYYAGSSYRFEREGLGHPWTLVSITPGHL